MFSWCEWGIRCFYLSTMRGREFFLFSNGLGMTHAKSHRGVALETLPSNLPNAQSQCTMKSSAS